jgi:acetyltransferase-like isoleucine patch superfamily enzyme
MSLSLIWKNIRAALWITYLKSRGVTVGSNVILKGKPVILRYSGSITLGDNVTLLSKSKRYHTAIYAPTRLMTDTREDAMIVIGDNTRINGASIHATESIIIGKNCLIAANVTIIDSDGHGIDSSERSLANPLSEPVVIEDNAWIGMNSIILKGVRIGKNSIIGAGSVVTKHVPENCVAAGNPARVLRNMEQNEQSAVR